MRITASAFTKKEATIHICTLDCHKERLALSEWLGIYLFYSSSLMIASEDGIALDEEKGTQFKGHFAVGHRISYKLQFNYMFLQLVRMVGSMARISVSWRPNRRNNKRVKGLININGLKT